ncbi:MAG: hypothetical protein JST10_04985 [Bacteroidetes bacterium]|nr:hypothetical protein [Bacteroidota bacterium]MBS1631909.1 hypothetical protein [Bacteroidota bacterium]
MSQRNNILQELTGLNSTLATATPQNIYTVPVGYFEELANKTLAHIKSIESDNAIAEIRYLSPFISNISGQNPYSIPEGYFADLPEKMLTAVQSDTVYQTSKEEISNLSPLLSGMSKEMPYSIPAGYFEKMSPVNSSQISTATQAKVIPIIHRKWFRYAAAAVVISFLALGGLVFESRPGIDPDKNPDEWIARNIKKVNTDKLDDFINLTNEEFLSKSTPVDRGIKQNEIKDLMKDVPESQIQEFINETSALDYDNSILN